VQYDVYVPPTPPATIRDSNITRPKAGSRDVYVPPPSSSRERELQACLDTAARYNSRLDEERPIDRKVSENKSGTRTDHARHRDHERGADTIDARRPAGS